MSDALRWMCDTYRAKLHDINPEACAEIDAMMVQAGQGWICDTTVVDPEELVTTRDIEARYGISQKAIQDFARRNKVPVRGRLGRTNVFRLGDILAARKKYLP